MLRRSIYYQRIILHKHQTMSIHTEVILFKTSTFGFQGELTDRDFYLFG